MKINTEINKLIEKSDGTLVEISSDLKYSFKRNKTYSREEILKFEETWKILLPTDYKNFLSEVGSCELYVNEYELGVVFHNLEDIEQYSEQVFIDMINPFPNLLLIVSLTGRGDEGGFNLSNDNDNFSIFFNEDDPENWIIETDKWISFSQWLSQLYFSYGQKDLP
jgi:hypothetical protein